MPAQKSARWIARAQAAADRLRQTGKSPSDALALIGGKENSDGARWSPAQTYAALEWCHAAAIAMALGEVESGSSDPSQKMDAFIATLTLDYVEAHDLYIRGRMEPWIDMARERGQAILDMMPNWRIGKRSRDGGARAYKSPEQAARRKKIVAAYRKMKGHNGRLSHWRLCELVAQQSESFHAGKHHLNRKTVDRLVRQHCPELVGCRRK